MQQNEIVATPFQSSTILMTLVHDLKQATACDINLVFMFMQTKQKDKFTVDTARVVLT